MYNRSMCGRYSLSVADAKVVYERFMISNRTFDFQPRYNIAPGQRNLKIDMYGCVDASNKTSRLLAKIRSSIVRDCVHRLRNRECSYDDIVKLEV